MEQTDGVLSELFASRRWKLANALGDTKQRVMRRPRGQTAEDLLRDVMGKFRAWQRESGSPNKGSGRRPEGRG